MRGWKKQRYIKQNAKPNAEKVSCLLCVKSDVGSPDAYHPDLAQLSVLLNFETSDARE